MKRSIVRVAAKAIVPMALFALSFAGSPRSADAHHEFEIGTLSTHLVPCDTLCTAGTLTGGLAGTFDYTLTTMNATPNPNVVILIGEFNITTTAGTLHGTDVTLWNLASGQFVDNGVFNAGTGAFARARGDLLLIGAFDLAAGTGSSHYRAIVKRR